MGKTRDQFKKIRDTKEHFMQSCTIKDRNVMDLTEADYPSKNIQKNSTKKILMTQITMIV